MKVFNEPINPQELVTEINDGGVKTAILYPLDYQNKICIIDVETVYPSRELYYCSDVKEEDYKILETIENAKYHQGITPDGIMQYWEDNEQI